MPTRHLQDVDARLLRRPDDPEAWIERARLGPRLAAPPPLDPALHRGTVLEALRQAPEVRALAGMALSGLDLVPLPGRSGGPFWELSGRRREDPAGDWDRSSGLPLRVERRRDGAEMRLVPGGSFRRGDSRGDPDQRPSRLVHLDNFYLDRFPVRVAAFQRYLDRTSTPPPFDWTTQRRDPERAVVQISWDGARDYARWAGADLPTEAEWEKAARGPDGRTFPWGEEAPDPSRAEFLDAHPALTHDVRFYRQDRWPRYRLPVGRHPAGCSPYGLEDMAGGVFEWCRDLYARTAYRSAPERDPPGPRRGRARVIRGGAWCSPAEALGAAVRARQLPWEGGVDVGFRLGTRLP